MTASNPKTGSLEAARTRWASSPSAGYQTYDEARQYCERVFMELRAVIYGLRDDPEISVERRDSPERIVPRKPRRVVLDFEGSFGSFVSRIKERLHHPDVDMWGMVCTADLIVATINAMGGRLENLARRGARNMRGSQKGGRVKKLETTARIFSEDELLIEEIARVRVKNPALKSARTLAERVKGKFKLSPETLRKRIERLKKTGQLRTS